MTASASASARGTSVRTVVDVLRDAVDRRPDQDAYVFLDGSLAESRRVNRAALECRARAIAARLVEHGLAGERALLVYPPGYEFLVAFFGCIFAGVVPVPVYPPDMNRFERSLAKLNAIHADATPAALLTTTEIFGLVEALKQHDPALGERRWLTTDDIDDSLADCWKPPSIDAGSVAFLQYTSGSTSSPKGVIVSHANLLHNWELQRRQLRLGPGSVHVSWLPLYHDMGLIGSATQALFSDALAVLMEPYTFLRRPAAWLEATTKYRGTTLGAPTFAYDLCVRKIPIDAGASLDLRTVTTALIAAEPVRAETMERFAKHFAPVGFRATAFFPSYGLAEATLIVAGAVLGEGPVTRRYLCEGLTRGIATPARVDEPSTQLASSGRQISDEQRLLVVDPDGRTVCSDRTIGEIWISGPSVAQGYWKNAAATEEVFGAHLRTGEGPFLRSGDLGFFDGGEIFLTGRIKDLVILNGLNHAPQDIELTVERAHRAVRPGCVSAFSVPSDSGEQLVVVTEIDSKKLTDDGASVAVELRAAIRAEHGIQTFAIAQIAPGTIPKTSSGKIQRRACRDAFLERTLELIAEDILPPRGEATPADRPRLAEPAELFLVSAPTEALLTRHLGELHRAVAASDVRPIDVAYTLGTMRARGAASVTFSARGREELLAQLDAARGRVPCASSVDARDAFENRFPFFRVSLERLEAGVAVDLAPLFSGRDARVVTLPTTPVATRELRPLRPPVPADAGPIPPAPTDKPRPGSAIAPSTLLAISRVTGHAAADLRLEQRLVSDLGFDSLMFVELGAALDGAFRDRGKVPDYFASDNPSIGEVISFLDGHFNQTSQAVREDACSIDAFPEVKDWKTRLLLPEALGIENPYFKVHDRVARDTSIVAAREVVNFASYNYLGLAGDPEITRAAVEALERYGTSASASRIASGERPPHGELERALAKFLGCESALTLVSGHATNVSVLGHLLGPQDLIVHDSLAHDSILAGAKLSGARRRAFPHNDVQALDHLLIEQRSRARRVLIAVEGVYSMDGDAAPLAELIAIKKRHQTLLYVDEAHSLGVLGNTGRGIGEHAGIDRRDVDLWMGTLSKSLASCGGYIAGSSTLIEFLKYSLPGFVYSVGLPPANAAAALAALSVLAREPERVETLRARSQFFLEQCRAHGIDTGLGGASAVVPVLVGSSIDSLRLSDALMRRGINVQPVLYPAVEEHLSRLRFFVSACHSEEQLAFTAKAVATELSTLGDPHRRPRAPEPGTSPTWVRPAGGREIQGPLARALPTPKRVFVTGGNGFIGSKVVRRLEREGHVVRCLLRRTSRTERLDGVRFESHFGDVRDLPSLVEGARGCDTIVHMASVSSWADIRAQKLALEDIIVGGTENVLEAAKVAGVKRVVVVSSATAVNGSDTPIVFDENAVFTLGETTLEYSKAKHRAGELSRRYVAEGLEIITLLPAEVYGPNDDALVTAGNLIDIVRSRPAYAPDGGTSIAHVDDVADGVVAAIDHGRSGERYILGGDCLTIRELMSLALSLNGRNYPVVSIPNDVLKRLCHSAAAKNLTPPISLDVLEYATRYWFVDSEKAMRELGYRPRGAEETLRPVVAWLRETRRIA